MDAATESDLLDVEAAAQFLGISVRSVYRLAAAGELPQYRVGRQLRFDASEMRAVLRQGTRRRSA
jgi:excisionase family DNA binding protein